MSLPLFVYGSQAADDVLGDRPRRPGTVRGELWGLPAGEPALRLRGARAVHGVWLDPVPDPLLGMLDLFFGVPQGLFRRSVISVATPRLSFDAWTWLMDNPEARGGRLIRPGGGAR